MERGRQATARPPPTEATAQKRKERPTPEVAAKSDGAQLSKRARRGTRTGETLGGGDEDEGDRGWGLLHCLDPDTSLCVLSFLPAEDLVRQRAVSRRWGDLASADCLWKPRFLRLYGPPFATGEEEGAAGSWFGRYAEASRGMPRMPRDQAARFPSELTNWEPVWEVDPAVDEEDGDGEFEIKDAQFSVVALPHLHQSEVGLRHHRLALHLAFLHTNEHVPRMTDRVRIGTTTKHATISLARLCYAVSHKKRNELLEQLGLRSVGGEAKDEVFLSPDVGDESDFQPFVRLRIPSPDSAFAPGERPLYGFVDEHAGTFGLPDDLGPGFQFVSDKRKGWAPGFFNASFEWYSYGCFTTLHNTTRREIFVIKTRERKAVW